MQSDVIGFNMAWYGMICYVFKRCDTIPYNMIEYDMTCYDPL